MSHTEDFEKHRGVLESVPSENIKEPYIPVRAYAQEAEDLVIWAQDDIRSLQGINYNIERFQLILEYCGALHYVDAQCTKDRRAQSEAMKTWQEEEAVAEELKAMLLHVFRFALDGYSDKLRAVDDIEQGASNADLVQDMMDLPVLGKENTELLSPYMDLALLDQAEEMSDRLGQVLAVANGDRHLPNASIELRNKVYTVLKEEVDHLRKCGKFLFWKNEKRVKGYSSAYMRKHNRARNRNAAVDQE